MQLVAPDILAEARGLTGAMSGTLCVLGFALWLFGWRWHRFWIVSGITLTAGLIGLNAGRTTGGTQVLAIGILLAVAAGMMALELAKVFAFVAGGCGAWLAVQWVFPQAQELWAVFLSGGLFGLLLYRVWTMLLTSLVGVLLGCHAGLLLLEDLLAFDAVKWLAENQAAMNGVAVGLTVLGILLQVVASRDEDEAETAKKADKPEKGRAKKSDHGHGHSDDHGHGHDNSHGHGHGHEKEKPAPWWRKLFATSKAA